MEIENDEAKKEMLITKATKYINDIFAKWFGGITFYELGILCFWFVIAGLFSVLIYFFSNLNNVLIKYLILGIVNLIIFLFFAWLCHTKKDGLKQWRLYLYLINYHLKNEKKNFNSPEIFELINIKEIDENGIITFINTSINSKKNIIEPKKENVLKKTGTIENKNNNEIKGKLFKLNGVNIELLTNYESNAVINATEFVWLKLAINHKIIIVDEKINLEPMNNFLDNELKKYEKNKTKETLIDFDQFINSKKEKKGYSEVEIVKNQLENYKDINNEIINKNLVNKGVYILFYYKNDKELNEAFNELRTAQVQGKMEIQEINEKDKVCDVLNNLFCNNSQIKWFDSKEKFGINHVMGNIEIKKDYFLANEGYYKIIEVKQFPSRVYAGWLKKISGYQNIQTIVSLEKTNAEFVRLNLERAKRKIKLNWEFVRSEGETHNMNEYINGLTNLIRDFAMGNLKPWYCNLQFILSASSESELKELTNQFVKELKSVDRFQFELLDYRQYNALSLIFSNWINQKKKLLTFNEIANDAIGAMYPFASNALKDIKGVLLGYEAYSGDPFYYDLKLKSGTRNSNVCLVCGKTGGGKTFTVSKLTNWFKCTGEKNGMKQYLVDPLGDYNGFYTNYNNVSKIDMADAKQGLINPLQILDEQKSLMTHASEFVVFIEMIAKKSLDAEMQKFIIQTLLELYKFKNINDDYKEVNEENGDKQKIYNHKNLKHNEWPTTDELYKFMENKLNKNKENISNSEKDVLAILWKLSKEGNYSGVWNGYTTLDTKNANIIIFDTHNLDADKDPILFNCQMYLLSGFLRGEALKNRDRNIGITDPEKMQWISIVIDEAHRWLKNNPIALKTMELLAREIRHHKGVLIISTQNISDFIGAPETILKQALYHIVLNMTPADVASYDKILKESGGLTENEKRYILDGSTIGSSLITIGSNYRCYVNITANDIEKHMWLNGAK